VANGGTFLPKELSASVPNVFLMVDTHELSADTAEDVSQEDGHADVTEDFDAYVDDLTQESTEALAEVEDLVGAAGEGAKETEDLGKDVRDVLNQLAEGDKFGAARAVIDSFSDENAQEADEAVSAAQEVMGEVEDTRAEGEDVARLLVDAAKSIEDEATQTDVFERINELV